MITLFTVVFAVALVEPPTTAPDGPTSRPATQPAAVNPPAPGFDAAGSDPRAIELADATMEAMGGRAAWNRTRHIAWNFFGARRHAWDRHTGDVRIEGGEGDDAFIILMNLHTKNGRVWRGGVLVDDPAERAEALQGGMEAWINDSYWLVMPYKLKDSGVTLKYRGERPLLDGRPAEVIELTFDGVGVTPGNKYDVYIAADTGLVEQWDFFVDREQRAPRFQTPWADWKPVGEIMLSGDRGRSQLTDIDIFDELPARVYESPDPVDWTSIESGGRSGSP